MCISMRRIDRSEAINIICTKELSEISQEERAEQLYAMTVENWEDHPGWSSLPNELRKEFAEYGDIDDPMNDRYDPILMIWLESNYAAARNSYLLAQLKRIGLDYDEVIGEPISLLPCPCCGYQTLSAYGCYQICTVCWWEDDDQDNEDANWIRSGPNYRLSLTRARFNFLKYGIADPDRKDLRNYQEPPEKYEKSRFFEIDRSGRGVFEKTTGWSATLDEEYSYKSIDDQQDT